MREVYAKLGQFGLNAGDSVKIHLLNSVGDVCNMVYSINETVVCGDDSLRVSLLENERIPFESHYQITLPNTLSFTFHLPISSDNLLHDLMSLVRMGCYEEFFIDGKLIPSFIEKLELFFTGENPHFTNKEQSLLNMYIFYADEVIDDGVATVDVALSMDDCLASIGVL